MFLTDCFHLKDPLSITQVDELSLQKAIFVLEAVSYSQCLRIVNDQVYFANGLNKKRVPLLIRDSLSLQDC